MKSNAAGGGPSLAPATDGRAAGQVKDDPDHQDDRKVVSSKKKNNKERRSRNKNNNGANEAEEEDSASGITSEEQRAGAHRIEGSSSVVAQFRTKKQGKLKQQALMGASSSWKLSWWKRTMNERGNLLLYSLKQLLWRNYQLRQLQ